jgi:hypothetical protein
VLVEAWELFKNLYLRFFVFTQVFGISLVNTPHRLWSLEDWIYFALQRAFPMLTLSSTLIQLGTKNKIVLMDVISGSALVLLSLLLLITKTHFQVTEKK